MKGGRGERLKTPTQQILTYHFKVLNEPKLGLGFYGKQITPPPPPRRDFLIHLIASMLVYEYLILNKSSVCVKGLRRT